MRGLRQNDGRLGVMAQIVQRRDQTPAVHLRLVDLLGAVVEAGGIAQTDRVGGGEQAEIGGWGDDLVLVEQGQLAVMLQHALDDEHHIRAARVVFVKHDGHVVAQGPGQDAFVEFGDLLAVAQLDRILADQVDPADMAVQVHPHTRPGQPCGNLLDMGGFAGAVIALDHHAAVVGKARKDRQRGIRVEFIGGVDHRYPVGRFGKALDLHVGVNPENLADRDVFGGFHGGIQHRFRPK